MLQTIKTQLRRAGLVTTALAIATAGVVVSAPAPAEAGTVCERPMLSQGSSRRSCIKALQTMINNMRPASSSPDLDVDGYFGTKTAAAVRAFQRVEGISADGIVGPITWRYLCRDRGVSVNHWVPNSEYGAWRTGYNQAC